MMLESVEMVESIPGVPSSSDGYGSTDVDGNESDSDSADTTMQADIDQNEADADAAIAALQTDVDGNESDADAADEVLRHFRCRPLPAAACAPNHRRTRAHRHARAAARPAARAGS